MGTLGADSLKGLRSKVRELHAGLKAGGFSVDNEGNSPQSGYMVSRPGTEIVNDDAGRKDVAHNLRKLAPSVKGEAPEASSGAYFGGWKDDDDGKEYFDVSDNVDDYGAAVSMARQGKQKSIYDVSNDKVIYDKDF